jgi:hypothetical protein
MKELAGKQKAKARGPAKPVKAPKKDTALDPCAKPQATESQHQKDEDDACDDGVK